MARFVVLIDYTEQGIRSIQDSPRRADGFAETARRHGVEIVDLYWTLGAHDGVLLLDAPDDQAVSALMLTLAAAGNVRTHTLRAYHRAEFERILARI